MELLQAKLISKRGTTFDIARTTLYRPNSCHLHNSVHWINQWILYKSCHKPLTSNCPRSWLRNSGWEQHSHGISLRKCGIT